MTSVYQLTNPKREHKQTHEVSRRALRWLTFADFADRAQRYEGRERQEGLLI